MSEQKPTKWDPVFDLNRDLLKLLGEEFHVSKPVDEFVRRTAGVEKGEWDKIAKEVFGDYGTKLMQRTFELGEQYVDKAYEVIKKYCSRPEVGLFPLVGQRFMEIAYLSINQNLSELQVLESNRANLEFWIDKEDCEMFAEELKKLSPDMVDTLPCRHACLSALNTLMEQIPVRDAELTMTARATEDGLCRFSMRRSHIVLPTEPVLHW